MQEYKVGQYVEAIMSEPLILDIEGKILDIIYNEHNEPYAEIQGYEGYWHLRCFQVVTR